MPRLSVIRVVFARQASDGNYGSETGRVEFELQAEEGDRMDAVLAEAWLAEARSVVEAELRHSASSRVRDAIDPLPDARGRGADPDNLEDLPF